MKTAQWAVLGRLQAVVPVLVMSAGLSIGWSRDLRAADDVSRAIDKGIEYLLRVAEQTQIVGDQGNHRYRQIGQMALETYALVVAGVSVDHPVIRRNFAYLQSNLHDREMNFTYTLSCYIFALDAAIAQREQDTLVVTPDRAKKKFKDNPSIGRAFRGPFREAVAKLLRLQKSNGGWHYGTDGDGYDVSNTQFAVLALGAGAKRGLPVSRDVWRTIMVFFIKGQDKNNSEVGARLTMQTPEEQAEPKHKVTVKVEPEDGGKKRAKEPEAKDKKTKDEGLTRAKTRTTSPEDPVVGTEDVKVYARPWGYTFPKNRLCWNMTCAGLSSLLLARENLRGTGLSPTVREDLNASIRNGYGWIMANWKPDPNGNGLYGLYSLEKVADIGGVKLFGSHDWYDEFSRTLVKMQQGDGSWPKIDKHGESPRVTTSFALLILNRATSIMLASRNPLERIMLSGRRSNLEDATDRNWVYVPDIDATLHYPTLLRTIHLRPHPKLIKFFENIVEHYPDEWKGELIPEMAKACAGIENRSARRVFEGHLASITGHRYDDLDLYKKWHRRWEKVVQIGSNREKEHIPYLLRYYKSTKKSIPLKKTVAWAILQCKATDAVDLFLEDLENEDPEMRAVAYRSFKAFFVDFPPPFDPLGSETARRQQIDAIRVWYEENGLPGSKR